MPEQPKDEGNRIETIFPCGHPNHGVIVPISLRADCNTCNQFYCETCEWNLFHTCGECGGEYMHGFVEQHKCPPDSLTGRTSAPRDPVGLFYTDRQFWLRVMQERYVSRVQNSRPWDEIAAESRQAPPVDVPAPIPPWVPPATVRPQARRGPTYGFTSPSVRDMQAGGRIQRGGRVNGSSPAGTTASFRWHHVVNWDGEAPSVADLEAPYNPEPDAEVDSEPVVGDEARLSTALHRGVDSVSVLDQELDVLLTPPPTINTQMSQLSTVASEAAAQAEHLTRLINRYRVN